jgi:archaellum component FlaG (FlaF/FlaG flagellin family)
MAKAKTRSGIKVFATIIDKVNDTGKKEAQDFKENMSIIFDQDLPQWNYVATPKSS